MTAKVRCLVAAFTAWAFFVPPPLAHGGRYVFHGVFEPTTHPFSSQLAIRTPSELMGLPFSLIVALPTDDADYSTDGQTGADYWGVYRSPVISLEIDVPGHELSVSDSNVNLEIFNDTVLEYWAGAPLSFGDELRLRGRAAWTRVVGGGEHPLEQSPLTMDLPLLLTLRASDFSGSLFTDDSLPTAFDPASFESIHIEFKEIVPVSGSDPRPIWHTQWNGRITSFVAASEPSSAYLVALAVLGTPLLKRRRATHG